MKGCLRSIVIFIVLVTILNQLMDLIDPSPSSYEVSDSDTSCVEHFTVNEYSNDRSHQRFWGFTEQNRSYCLRYNSQEEIKAIQENERLRMSILYSEGNFWGRIYSGLVNQTRDELDYIADSLVNQAKIYDYTRLDLARLTVSFVQDIPYSFVIPGDCESYETDGKPCAGNKPYGIVSPYEFTHDLHGDCDTRAVLLYILLEDMGYDPMIVVSEEYAHAMLALNIPAQGDHLTYAGEKYYFWETTAKGWPIGMLPPDSNNIDYWEIALVNES